MTVYKGSVAQSELSKGNNAFTEGYKGSQKIYGQKAKGIPAFGAKYNFGSLEFYVFLFGGWTSDAICGAIDSNPITQLSGTLGQAGSNVVIPDVNQNYQTYPYKGTVVYNGINFFLYYYDITGSGWSNGRYMRILVEESAVGTYAISPYLDAQYGNPYPMNFTANSFNINMSLLGIYTATKDSSLDFIWDGISIHASMNT